MPIRKKQLMHRIYQNFLFVVIIVFFSSPILAQVDTIPGKLPVDTVPGISVNPQLIDIFNARPPKDYVIAGITVTGSKSFDQNLIISISGLAVGDKVQIPGTDVFSKAINKLWKQNLIADVEVLFTNLVGNNLYVELAITERPRLEDYKFIGIKKGEKDDLDAKMGLTKGRVVTDNMKVNAADVIQKFFADKGYRNAKVNITETPAPSANAVLLTIIVDKGN